MLRHLRAHVADDGLDDRQRDSRHSCVIAERVATGVQVLHADSPCPAFRHAGCLNPKPFEKLFYPIGNAVRIRQIHFCVFRKYIFGFRPLRRREHGVKLIGDGNLNGGPGFARLTRNQAMDKIDLRPLERADVTLAQSGPYGHHEQRACEAVQIIVDEFKLFGRECLACLRIWLRPAIIPWKMMDGNGILRLFSEKNFFQCGFDAIYAFSIIITR